MVSDADGLNERESALPESPGDMSCLRCGMTIRGSDAPSPEVRKEAHIVHFETRHARGSKQRDRAMYRRAVAYDVDNIELVSSVEVFRRDHYTCQLCGKGLLLNLRKGHSKGPSVDHIVWLSRGGSHTLANCQTAHLGCNTREGMPYRDTALRPGEANRYRREREARERRSRAARERYRRRKNRQTLMGCLTIVGLLLVVVVLGTCLAQ
jgi:5-methylcytosine-specific restriction endonuclease McrA